MSVRRPSVPLAAVVLTLGLPALVVFPSAAAAATSAQYASSWQGSPASGGVWIPSPTSGNVLGAPDSFCVAVSSSPGGATATFAFSGFSIPASDVIQGVEVRMKYETEGDHDVQLTDMGALVGSVRVMPPSSGPSNCNGTSFVMAGGPTDTWGAALTPAKFNAGDIGFKFNQRLITLPNGDPGSTTVDIDAVELVVYHGPANSAPTAEANGPYSVGEGGSVALSSVGSSDPDGDALTFEWDLDNNGTFETAGASPVFSAAGIDGPATRTVNLRVSDGLASDTDSATVNISNVAPTIDTIVSSAAAIDEGQSVTVSGTFSDPASAFETYSGSALWSDGAVTTVTLGAGTFETARLFDDDDPTATPSDTFTVDITIDDGDGGSDTATSPIVTVNNVAPTVAPPGVVPEPSDEGEAVSASATFTDPGTDTFTCSVDFGDGSGAVAGSVAAGSCSAGGHVYGDNGTFTVEICVTDDDGGTGCESASHEVLNVPPTVAPPVVDPEPSDEGTAVTASADFTDPGTDDAPFTCTVDYDTADASVPAVAGTVTGMTCAGPSHVYGDNGSFTVEVCVTDKDGGVGCESAVHTVLNLDPTAALDLSTAIVFPSGDAAFLGRQGDEQSHDADGDDPGSDDLTFDWDFGFAGSGASTTYYNDTGDPSGTPDPLPSPHGDYPFSVSDTAAVTFAAPGVYAVHVDLTDDDGGSDSDELAKLVTGNTDCARSHGYWRHQFSGKGRAHIDTATLQAYLDLVDFASGVFSELVPAGLPLEAQAVFAPGGSKRHKATLEALAAWLNWASGAVAWSEPIDTDGDGMTDTPFATVIAMVETILLDPGAGKAQLVLAKDLAEAVNLLDEGSGSCDD